VPQSLFATTTEAQATEITQLIFGSASYTREAIAQRRAIRELLREANETLERFRKS
jgi:hypothetical protein